MSTYGAHTAADVFKAEAARNTAAAGISTGKTVAQIAVARSPQEREMLVDQVARLYNHLAIGGYIDEKQRQQSIEQFLNRADVVSVEAALDDPTRDPSALARTLIQRKQYFHLKKEQVTQLAERARNEAIRRDSLGQATASVADIAAASEAAIMPTSKSCWKRPLARGVIS